MRSLNELGQSSYQLANTDLRFCTLYVKILYDHVMIFQLLLTQSFI